ncbi:Acetylesterase [Paramyrothecium foliicola]|nr:Acetylesterase [Paramyrothecium foliicola]
MGWSTKMVHVAAPVILALAAVANAQANLWGQCGGQGYTGPTVCVDGAACTSYNPWYYQCVPATGQASSTKPPATSTSKPPVSTSTSKPPSSTSKPPSSTSKPPSTTSKPPTSSSTSKPPTSTDDECSGIPPVQTGQAGANGDSYSQTGFDINGQKPSAANPIGNPPLPGWTASGGLDWPGYLVTEFNSSLTLSYNFAYGGATVDANLVAPYAPTVLSLIDQVKIFSDNLASKPSYAPWTEKNTVAGVWMGVNDVGNSFWLDNQPTRQGAILDAYFKQIKIIYDAGVRQFVLLTVPPTDKSPLMAGGQTPDGLKQLQSAISSWNQILASKLATFRSANAGTDIKVVDTALAFNAAINNPQQYGAPNASCFNADGVSCLWFNDYHPATAIQRLVASQVAAAWSSFFKCTNSIFC